MVIGYLWPLSVAVIGDSTKVGETLIIFFSVPLFSFPVASDIPPPPDQHLRFPAHIARYHGPSEDSPVETCDDEH